MSRSRAGGHETESAKKSMPANQIRISIDSQLKHAALVGLVTRSACGYLGLSATESYEIELCVVETVNNAVEHAYGNEPGHRVEVSLTLETGRMVLEIRDWGQSLDADEDLTDQPRLQALNSDPMEALERGMGLAIIHQVMDQVRYHASGSGNCLRLTKSLNQPDEDQARLTEGLDPMNA